MQQGNMKQVTEIAPGLERFIISGGSLTFGRADRRFRELVRRAYADLQVPVLRHFGEIVNDKALRPVDSIGWKGELGILTDMVPQRGYQHIILALAGPNGAFRPIGMRVTDEISVPDLGSVLMEYFSGMVHPDFADKTFSTANGSEKLTVYEILCMTSRFENFTAAISDGVGIDKKVLAANGFEKYGPAGQTMVWVPPMNAETREQYKKAIPMELYVRPGENYPGISFKAGIFMAVEKYIREGSTELDPRRLKRAGYTFDTLPAVALTRDMHKLVAAAYDGRIPTSPIT